MASSRSSSACPAQPRADGQLLLEHAGLTKTLAAIAKGERKADADAMTVTVISTTSGPVLAAGGYEIPLHASPSVQDFPTLPPVMPGTHVVDRATFSHTAARVLVAADLGDTLPILTGIHLTLERDNVHLVATDRYRLATARVSTTGTSDETTLVPGAFLGKVLKRMSEQTLSINVDSTDGTRWVTWSSGQTTAMTLELGRGVPQGGLDHPGQHRVHCHRGPHRSHDQSRSPCTWSPRANRSWPPTSRQDLPTRVPTCTY